MEEKKKIYYFFKNGEFIDAVEETSTRNAQKQMIEIGFPEDSYDFVLIYDTKKDCYSSEKFYF